MNAYTDFLAYGEGTYHKTADAMKFNGQHIVKIIGWTKSMDGSTEWIIENTWGEDWGEKGYAKISSKGDTNIEGMVFGMLISHQTAAEIAEARSQPPPPSSPASNPLGDMMQAARDKEEEEEDGAPDIQFDMGGDDDGENYEEE